MSNEKNKKKNLKKESYRVVEKIKVINKQNKLPYFVINSLDCIQQNGMNEFNRLEDTEWR